MSKTDSDALICIRDELHVDRLLVNAAYFTAKGLHGSRDGGDVGEQGLIALLDHIADRLEMRERDAQRLQDTVQGAPA